MTERSMNTQPLMERDALSPSEPATDEIVVLGYDSHPIRTEVLPVVPGQEKQLTPEEKRNMRIDHDAKAMMREFDGWLQFKVKTELVSQIFKGLKKVDSEQEAEENEGLTEQEIADKDIEKKYIDITKIAAIISTEVTEFSNTHYQSARGLENEIIPEAEMRDSPVLDSKNPSIYWKKDVSNLFERVDVHDEIVARIELLGVKDPEVMDAFVDAYIARANEDARDEVIKILLQQKNDLESQGIKQAKKIKELEDTLDLLVEQTTDTLEDEFVSHLADAARSIAR